MRVSDYNVVATGVMGYGGCPRVWPRRKQVCIEAGIAERLDEIKGGRLWSWDRRQCPVAGPVLLPLSSPGQS